MAGLFGKSKLHEAAGKIHTDQIQSRLDLVRTWHKDYHEGTLKADNETAREQQYNQDFFKTVLGYVEKPTLPFTFEPKGTTEVKDFPDAVLRYTDSGQSIDHIFGVVELKGATVNLDRPQKDRKNRSPVQQGFDYKTAYRRCPFVVVSNFWEFRLYNDNRLDYEVWTLDDLVDPADDYLKFKSWYVLMHVENFTAAHGQSATELLLSDIRQKQEEIGKDFYGEYKEARLGLLRDIWVNNPTTHDSFEDVIQKTQTIIDRVVFACFAEDRMLLPDNIVARIVKISDESPYGEPLFQHLKNLFTAIDKGNDRLGIPTGYNGGLFGDDELLNSLIISNDTLRKLTDLSGYDFKEDLRVNVLGHIFEQSITDLEEIKRLVGADRDEENPFHESKLPAELKIGRRKKEGIFYTPDYIVDYIVEQSLGAFLHGKEEEFKKKHNLSGTRTEKGYGTRERMAYTEYQHVLQNIKVLDPACGSGAFLTGAFRYLYGENRRVAEILGSAIFSEDEFVRSILTDNLFGVDINEESVEITKLSLWLMTAQKNKSLTSLDDNIKVGNSLIDEVDTDPSTAFDWPTAFPKIMAAGGFDIIIGNPPYVRVQNIPSDHVDYFFEKYEVPTGKLDLSILFFERALGLLKPEGRAGFISSSQWMQTDYGTNLRKLLAGAGDLVEIVDFGSLHVFEASTYPAIFILGKSDGDHTRYARIDSDEQLNVASIVATERRDVQISDFGEAPWQFGLFNLTEHLTASGTAYIPLSDVAAAYYGIVTGRDEAFVITKEDAQKRGFETEILHHFVNRGNEVFRYDQVQPGSFIIYPYERGPNGEAVLMTPQHLEDNYPKIYAHLLSDRETLEQRKDSRRLYATGDRWFCLVRPGDFTLVDAHKLIVKGIDKRPIVADADSGNAFSGQNCAGIIMNDPVSGVNETYIWGLLNSRLIGYHLNNVVPTKLSNNFKYNSGSLNQVPIVGAGDMQIEGWVSDASSIARTRWSRSVDFRALLIANFGVKWPVRLIEWWDLDFGEFLARTRVRASLTQKAELMAHWEGVRSDCLTYTDSLRKLDRKIDLKVYNIYGLTRRQRSIVDEYFETREI